MRNERNIIIIIIIIIIQESVFRKGIWKEENKNVEGRKEE